MKTPNETLITGIGVLSPSGIGAEALWEDCLNKKSQTSDGLGCISDKDFKSLCSLVNESPWLKKKPLSLERSLYFSLYSIISAISDAGWKEFNQSDVLLIGTTTGQLSSWETKFIDLCQKKLEEEDLSYLDKQPLGNLGDSLREALSFPGKIHIISSACSASTQALGMAHDYLNSKRSERVIVGGVEELGQLTIKGFGSLKLLSNKSCTPFDQERSGINLSEGSAFYTFEKKSLMRPHAYIVGGRTFLDSYHMTSPHPEGRGYKRSIIESLKQADITSDEIDLVHAHGTGTFNNDQAEANAIGEIIGASTPVISTKGVHGHALGASGAIELSLCIQILKSAMIPPITGLNNVDPEFKLLLPKEKIERKVTYLLKSTLGFGGVNSSIILKGVAQ